MRARGGGAGGRRAMISGRYVLRRLGQMVPLLLGILVITFTLIHLAPGDPIYLLAGQGGDERYYAEQRARYGLDRPLPEQFVRYVLGVLRGDLGYSFTYSRPVLEVVAGRVPASMLLSLTGLLLATAVGLLLGVVAGARPGGVVDFAASLLALVGAATPAFFLGQVLILVFAAELGLFPVQGMRTARAAYTGWQDVLDIAHHLVLPALTLGLLQLALIARLTRAGLREALAEEYVRTARAKGLPPLRVLLDHALRNALLPVATVLGGHLGTVLTGAVLTEIIFAWPGLGRLLYDATLARDYPLLLALLMLASIAVLLGNLVTDLVYAVLDPRVRYG